MLWIVAGIVAGIGTLVLLLWGLHRLCIYLEDCGYIYYREKSSGGGVSSALLEIDKITQPRTEHVIEAKDTPVKQQQQRIDGD